MHVQCLFLSDQPCRLSQDGIAIADPNFAGSPLLVLTRFAYMMIVISKKIAGSPLLVLTRFAYMMIVISKKTVFQAVKFLQSYWMLVCWW